MALGIRSNPRALVRKDEQVRLRESDEMLHRPTTQRCFPSYLDPTQETRNLVQGSRHYIRGYFSPPWTDPHPFHQRNCQRYGRVLTQRTH